VNHSKNKMADSVHNNEKPSGIDRLEEMVAKQSERIAKLEENLNSMDRVDKTFASLGEDFSRETGLEKEIDKQEEETSKLKYQLEDQEEDIRELKEKVYQLAKELGMEDIARIKADYDLAQRK
jgi:predicted RNase H-like nuclease (RuvC/YqgF family)